MFIQMTDRRERSLNGHELELAYEDAIQGLPGVRAEMRPQQMGPPVGKEIQIQLSGQDLEVLARESRKLSAHMKTMDGLVAVDDTAPVPGIEWQLEVDRAKAAMSGVDVSSIGAAIQLITNGILVGKYRPDDAEDEVDIRVRYPEDYRGISHLDQLRVSTQAGQVPISSFVERQAKPKVSTIFRQNGNRVMYVRANTAQGVLANEQVEEIRAWLATQAIDPSVSVVFRGANEEQEAVAQFIGIAFTLSLLLMGILLVTQFNSFYQATLVLSAVVMSTVGVLLGLLITGYAFSAIMTGIGIVALAGIIVNNNIVLIDTFNYLRRENPGWDLQRVIITTGCQRLRPVFLTTFTTGFGLLPMAAGVSIDLIGREVEVGGPVASYWVQLASAIVSGLSFATLLTLIVTPSLLMAPQAIRQQFSELEAKFQWLLNRSTRSSQG
jgi:multidrug efflux pump